MDFNEQMRLAKFQFENRTDRLLKLCLMNAPETIINDELKLVKEVSTRLTLLARQESGEDVTAEFTGHSMIKNAVNNAVYEELNEENETKWKNLTTLIVNSIHDAQPMGQSVRPIVEESIKTFRKENNILY